MVLCLLGAASGACQQSSARPLPAKGAGDASTVRGPAAALHGPSEWFADNASTPAPTADLVTRSRAAMGTRFRVMVAAGGRDEVAAHVAGMVLDEAVRLEGMMSEWKPESALSKVNARAGVAAAAVPLELFQVLARATEVAIASEGAFDPTWAALWNLWRFDRPPRLPSRDEIAAPLALVGYRDIVLDPAVRTAFLRRKGMLLGLGSVAKGYALDRGAALLRSRGFQNFIIDGGGQVYASGTRGSRPWRVGIQDPRDRGRWFAVLELRDASLSTSGDYEHFFEVDGIRYHHILDLRTGYPARGCRSVTVLAADATTADALSTAAFVLGAKRGLQLLRRFPGADGIVVDDENRVHVSRELRDKVLVRAPTP